ncbi:hypothetical protein SAMN02927924_02830 [Sphingobium faniae]|nr:hypothetical protein SAMN02927924_02830 [Sphingobium faniae]
MFSLALLIAATSPSPALTTVVLDYRGACGGSLIETRRRERIERNAHKVIREAKQAGREVRVLIRDDSVPGGLIPVSVSARGYDAPVINRSFACD